MEDKLSSIGSLILIFFLASCQTKRSELQEFVLHPDFEMTMVAAEPLITDPVDLEFDAAGDAYVLQMPGYPKGIDQSSIVKLMDVDQDGIYDRSIIFAENLNQASSLMPYREGFLVAAPPDLLYLRDEDGDGKADTRSVLMTGFSNGNLQHNFNGITYGLDNWIHFANGGNGGETRWVDSDSTLQINGYDFQIKPELRQFQWSGRSSGGFELAMDKWGNFYGTHNLHHVNMIVFPHRYIEGLTLNPRNTLRNISDHEENGLARVYPIGEQETRVNHPEQSGYFSGACGITYYGGGAFSSEFEGNIFVNDVVLNLVHRDIINNESSYYSAGRGRTGVDFLTSRDRSFRPVNSTVGPDGALYIVDMYRRVIEHPEWIPDELEANMDLDAGKQQGRIYRIHEKGHEFPQWQMPAMNAEAWITRLQSPNLWVRMTAQRIILENKWDCADQLVTLFEGNIRPEVKIHILYLLQGMGKDLQPVLLSALEQDDHEVKRHALICAEPYLLNNEMLRSKLFECGESGEPRLQLQSALSMSTLPTRYNDEIFPVATSILDRHLEDPYIRMACMAALKDQPLALARHIKEHDSMIITEGGKSVLEMMAYRFSQREDPVEVLEFIQIFSGQTERDQIALEVVMDVLSRTGVELENSQKLAFVRQLNMLEEKGSLAVIAASWNLRNSIGLPSGSNIQKEINKARDMLYTKEAGEREKIDAIHLLAFGEWKSVAEDLFKLVDARNSIRIQEAALNVLTENDEPEIMQRLVDNWQTLSPTIRRRITDLLIYNANNHDLLFASLESKKLNLSEFNFDLERRRRLLNSKNEETSKRAQALFSDAGVIQRKDAIEKMRSALTLAGDVEDGKAIFTTQCATCHRYGDLGNEVGPDLTEISRKSKETLLHDILDPNAGADPEYINHIVETQDGQVISGIVEEETDDALFLKMMGGTEKTIPKNQIKSLSSTGLSLMPEGLEGLMSEKDMADLLAFLQKPVM